MSKFIQEFSWDELVEYYTQKAHFALLTDGGKGLRQTIHEAMAQACFWQDYQKKIKEVKMVDKVYDKGKKLSIEEKLEIAVELLDIYDEFDINFETEPTQATKDRVVYLNRLLGR